MHQTHRSAYALQVTSRPLACVGFQSYRYRHGHSFVMIGALNDTDALRQAHLSIACTPQSEHLERWNGSSYGPCLQPQAAAH